MRFKDSLTIFVLAAASLFVAACQGTETGSGTTTTSTPEPDPESICITWADASCASFAECCGQGRSFDAFECTTELSDICMSGIGIDLIHAGAIVFDEAAAKTCFAPYTGCTLDLPSSPAMEEACRNVITGFRPVGSGCGASYECERPESGYAMCYPGFDPFGVGVCAAVVPSTDGKCRFDKDTFTLSTCPAGTYCGVTIPEPQADDAVPSDYSYAFEADCIPYLAVGEWCVVVEGYDYQFLPCAEGLYCQLDGLDVELSQCAVKVPIGEYCTGNQDDECVDGAQCKYETHTCEKATGGEGLFCYMPDYCGDGLCADSEDQFSCPGDCGYCGDDVCSGDEDEYSCMEDCGNCGDGMCDEFAGEYPETCPEDCGYCGDAYCDEPKGEDASSCPDDCPGYCGDGYCAPGEEQSCAADCAVTCISCSEFITQGGDLSQMCANNGPPSSVDLYWAFAECVCGGSGACTQACSSSLCAGQSSSNACDSCIVDTSAGCGNDLNACANDN